MTSYAVDFSDVQGLVRFGYGALTEASFLCCAFAMPRLLSAWLAAAPVTNAVELDKAPQTALHVAFTRQGLEALRLSPAESSPASRMSFSPASGEKKIVRIGWAT